MKKRVLFGTDGIRAKANCSPMTVEIAMSLGSALAYLVKSGELGRKDRAHHPRIVIGKDTRLSGYCFEQAIAAGICSMGVDVNLVGPLPTPGIAFITKSMRADAGIVVSASHNPFYDNGIKIFDQDGYKLEDDIELRLEALMLGKDLPSLRPVGENIGKAIRIDDAIGRYVVYLKSVFPDSMTLDGVRIVLDCANGAAYKVAPAVFRELGAEVIALGVEPNGTNINDKVGALFPTRAQLTVKKHGAQIGIALDGDADRLAVIDEQGELVDGDVVIGLLSEHLHNKGQLNSNTIVTTVMSNVGLKKYLERIGIGTECAQVGDRYVIERMRENGFSFGGEQSGHLIFSDYATTGDGIIAALMLLAMMLEKKKPLSLLKQIFSPSPRKLLSFEVPRKVALVKLPRANAMIADVERKLGQSGRVFVRYSGTENKARVLVEGLNQDKADTYAKDISELMKTEINEVIESEV